MESPTQVRPASGVKFLAVCPFCKVMKFRAPLSRYAEFVECRHCQKMFILVPDDPSSVPADLLAAAEAKANGKPREDLQYVPSPPPTEQVATQAEVARPIIVPEVKPGPNVPLGFALAAAILFGAGILLTQIPYGRFGGLGLCVVGLILAALSLLGLEKKQWLGYAGLGLNAVGILLIVALPDWLGGPSWMPPHDDSLDNNAPMAVGRNGGARQPADWVDAGSAVWEHRDVRIEIITVIVALSEPTRDRKREPVLRVGVRITNIGAARAIEFGSWTAVPPLPQTPGATSALTATAGLIANAPKVLPGKSIDAVLIYPPPSGPSAALRLELPAEAFGDEGSIRFEIPASMVRRNLTRPAGSP